MWQAHKLKRVVTSSIEVETLTVLEACREAVYVYHVPSLHQRQEHHPHCQPQAEGRDEGDVLPVRSKKERIWELINKVYINSIGCDVK